MTMTTKPKTRKASAKRAALKTAAAATKQASGEPKRTISGICRLLARWRFLEAEEVYLAAISPDEESDAALCKHQREQDEIEIKLSKSIPQDFSDVRELLQFAADMIEEGDRPDHGGQMMLRNGLESLPEVFSGERETARIAGLEEMRRLSAI
jgi:hypothetical protein